MLLAGRNPYPCPVPSSQPGFWAPSGVHNLQQLGKGCCPGNKARARAGCVCGGKGGGRGDKGKERKGREGEPGERARQRKSVPAQGGGGGAPAKAAAFSSTALVVAMATWALAIPSDIKMPPPSPPPAAGAGVLRTARWEMCAQTHARPPRGPGHGWLGLDHSFMHHLWCPHSQSALPPSGCFCLSF